MNRSLRRKGGTLRKTISVPVETSAKMAEMKHVNWSGLATEAFEKEILSKGPALDDSVQVKVFSGSIRTLERRANKWLNEIPGIKILDFSQVVTKGYEIAPGDFLELYTLTIFYTIPGPKEEDHEKGQVPGDPHHIANEEPDSEDH